MEKRRKKQKWKWVLHFKEVRVLRGGPVPHKGPNDFRKGTAEKRKDKEETPKTTQTQQRHNRIPQKCREKEWQEWNISVAVTVSVSPESRRRIHVLC